MVIPEGSDPGGTETTLQHLEAVHHLEVLHRLTAATLAATTEELIYEAALEAVISALGADRAAVLLLDPDGVIRFKASRGLSEEYRRATEGPGGPAPDPIVVAAAEADQSPGSARDGVPAEGVGPVAFVPVLYGERLLGKLMLHRDHPRGFDSGELALARTVAGHVAVALEQRRLGDELRRAAETMSATLDAVSDGITVQAPDGTLLMANQAAAAITGFSSVAELMAAGLGAIRDRFELLDLEGRPLSAEALPGRTALRGERAPDVLVRWRVVGTGAEHYSRVGGHPVFDERGGVRFAVNVFRDVTERQRAMTALRASEARLAFLASASRRLLAVPLDPREVLQQVVDLVVPELADWCSVREIVDGAQPQRVAFGYHDPAAAELVAGLDTYGDRLSASPAMDSLLRGEPVLLAELTPEMLERSSFDADHLKLLRRLDVRSVMLVPLRVRGRTTGILSLAGSAARPSYTEADLALVEELAARAAAMVDNAQAYAREHATAETLARALLPGRLPEIPGLEIAARYRPAGDVGGDFYDCFAVAGGGWMVVVGDVCGRGIAAASMTGLTRHTIRAAALNATSPAELLAVVNRLLVEAVGEQTEGWLADGKSEPSFCTLCLALVNPTVTGAHVAVASAGHPLPLLVRGNREVVEVGRPGSLLGVLADIDAADVSCDLGAGDALVLFTDGITERREAGRFFSDELVATLERGPCISAEELASRVEAGAVAFSTATPDDDMAVIVVSVPVTAPAGVDRGGERAAPPEMSDA